MEVKEQCECRHFETNENCADKNDLSRDLKTLVDKIAKKEGFISYNLATKKIIADGTNFLGVLTEVKILDNVTEKNLNLFVKSLIPNPETLTTLSVPDAYCMEVYFYLELSKLLEKLQVEAQVPQTERYRFVKCYKESNTEHIIMDNMIKEKYGTWNRFEVISFDFAEKSIKLLAKFHALGFVLQEKMPEYYDRKIKPFKYPIKFNEEYNTFYVNMAKNAIDYLEGSARTKFEKAVDDLFTKGKKYIQDHDTTLTMCHGDYRPNNILIREIEGEIADMIPIDYQLVHHGTPFADLMYFIFGATDRTFRRKHLDDLKDLYHDTMKLFLKYFEMDIQKYFPKEEYQRMFEERLDLGLFFGFWYLQGNLAQQGNIPDFSESQFSEVDFGKNELAQTRIRELIDDFIDWGYL